MRLRLSSTSHRLTNPLCTLPSSMLRLRIRLPSTLPRTTSMLCLQLMLWTSLTIMALTQMKMMRLTMLRFLRTASQLGCQHQSSASLYHNQNKDPLQEGDVATGDVQLASVLASARASYLLLSILVNLQYSSAMLRQLFKSAMLRLGLGMCRHMYISDQSQCSLDVGYLCRAYVHTKETDRDRR